MIRNDIIIALIQFDPFFPQASPLPDVSWVKDGVPVPKHITITNSDKGSQLLIPTSERADSGIYTITVKNIVGQESFNVEIRVTGTYNVNIPAQK